MISENVGTWISNGKMVDVWKCEVDFILNVYGEDGVHYAQIRVDEPDAVYPLVQTLLGGEPLE